MAATASPRLASAATVAGTMVMYREMGGVNMGLLVSTSRTGGIDRTACGCELDGVRYVAAARWSTRLRQWSASTVVKMPSR
jgi:hypothetical protein